MGKTIARSPKKARTAGAVRRKKAVKNAPLVRRNANIPGQRFVFLGKWHDYSVFLVHQAEDSDYWAHTSLMVGCRDFASPKEAYAHWRGGVSRLSGQPRPEAEYLIALARVVAKAVGWKWGAKKEASK